jgi:hypothetical protein
VKTPEWTLKKLKEAREMISQGWIQGSYSRAEAGVTCFCAKGALFGACEDISTALDLAYLLEDDLPEGYGGLVSFNDEKGRTKEEVLALYDRTIARLEGAA